MTGSYLARRLLDVVPVLLGVSLLIFFMIHLVPGDPAQTMLGTRATPELVRELHHRWGLDRSLPTQYLLFLKRLLHADTGDSLFYQVPTRTLVAARVGVTLQLLALAAILAVCVTMPLAALAATAKDKLRDQIVRVVPLVGLGMPSFWLGILLLLGFGLELRWFPVGGYSGGFGGHLHSLFLPALTIALALAPILVRNLRASMIDVLDSEFVAAARAKGLRESQVMGRHVVRNAVVPTVTLLGVNIGFLVGGTLIVEKVFALPGLGALMIDSIVDRDFPVVQGVTVVLALLVIAVNLATDLVYSLLDPRVELR
jgi:peptide/nickel transport system permease protein